jgi:hypothetical protein
MGRDSVFEKASQLDPDNSFAQWEISNKLRLNYSPQGYNLALGRQSDVCEQHSKRHVLKTDRLRNYSL